MKEFLAEQFPELVFENSSARVITDVKEEYLSLRHGIGVRDISDSTFLILRGIDSFDYLNRITTNTITDLPVLNKATTLFINDKGKIIDKAVVIRITDYCFVIGGRGSSARLKSWIERYLTSENIKIEDMTGKYAVLEISGSQAESYMNLVFGEVLESINEQLVIISEIEDAKIYIAKFKGYNGSPKYVIFSDASNSEPIAKYLYEQKSFFDFNFIGEDAFNIYRIEQGIPLYPNEFKDMFTPVELNHLDGVNLAKERFIGKEAISRSKSLQKKVRSLTGVSIDCKCDAELPARIFTEDNSDAGLLTSFVWSHSLSKQIGLAVIDKKFIDEPVPLFFNDIENNKQSLIITTLPFRK